MWHRDDPFREDFTPPGVDEQLEPGAAVFADTLEFGDPELRLSNVAEPKRRQWREQITHIGGPSPLLFFKDSDRARIELTAAHPGGLAQFIAGKPTLLSSLVRDTPALRTAKVAARALVAKGIELGAARGLKAIKLGIGTAEWKYDSQDHRAPVLLHPVSIRRRGVDFELRLTGRPEFNPSLQRSLKHQFQIHLDTDALLRLVREQGLFKPQPIIERLRGLTSHLSQFSVQPRLLVSSFAEVSSDMLALAENLDHTLLDALGGNPTAERIVTQSNQLAEQDDMDSRHPDIDHLVLDADEEQDRVLVQVAAGNSLVVNALPGAGLTQTVVNAIGALTAQNKRVLVVSPRQSTLTAIRQRLETLRLSGLAVRAESIRNDLIQAILRAERAKRPKASEINAALVRLRSVLQNYRYALSEPNERYGVSALRAMDELIRLSLLPEPPVTAVRIGEEFLPQLVKSFDRAAEQLTELAAIEQERGRVGESPWWGVSFASREHPEEIRSCAETLSKNLPELVSVIDRVIGQTPLVPPATVAESVRYLKLLRSLRETLDKFYPDIFDRPLTELILVTGPKQDAKQFSGGDRRRLKGLIKEYLRPGARVDDLHTKLQEIQEQRTLWQRYCPTGEEPLSALGLEDLAGQIEKVSADLARLDAALSVHSEQGSLAETPFVQLSELLQKLLADTNTLDDLERRSELRQEVEEMGLGELLEDLMSRKTAPERYRAEVELAWWQSVLEDMLESDPALLRAQPGIIDRLESDYRLVDEVHVTSVAAALAWNLAESWKIQVADYPDQAENLRQLLRSREHPGAAEFAKKAPQLLPALSPVWLSSPYLIHEVPDALRFDAVILVDAAAVTLAEVAPAIRRAGQVVAFGDPVTQKVSNFSIALSDGAAEQDAQAEALPSAFLELMELLPEFAITHNYRTGGEDLSDLISKRFYQGRIRSLPWAGQLLGHSSLSFEMVEDGLAAPDPETGRVESLDIEIERVLRLAVAHARNTPEQSMMIVTPSSKHARRLERSVLAVAARQPELAKFLSNERSEPFLVSTLEHAAAQTRDRVILSVGFGRTPHGMLLSEVGSLSKPGGEELLATVLSSARRHLAIVACFGPEDIDPQRTGHGMKTLRRILQEVSAGAEAEFEPHSDDLMLVDLARRLEAQGVRAVLGYRGKISLAVQLGGKALAIETDRQLLRTGLRESLRIRRHTLNRLGWHYLRVHSFELFADPDRVVSKVLKILADSDSQEEQGLPSIESRAS